MESPAAPAGPIRCLLRAADALRDDPVGLLLPAAGALLAQSLAAYAVRLAWDRGAADLIVGLGAAALIPWVLGAFLRSRWVAVAARNAGFEVGTWGRPLPLLGVQLIVGLASTLAWAIPAVPLGVAGGWLGSRGLFAVGAVVIAVGAVAGALAALAVRALFALAVPEVVVGGRSALDALGVSARRGSRELGPLAALVLAGDVATVAGGLFCGAAALPGYPLTDLAVLHRWGGLG